MPHESKINRRHEKPMVIELKDEFKDSAPPPARTYKTPYHLLEILKNVSQKCLKRDGYDPQPPNIARPF